MRIEVLYFEDCPNHLPTVERINAVLYEEGCSAEVREVLVPDVQTAQRVKLPWLPDGAGEWHRYRTGSRG
jgi:hypothetical protein